MWDFGQRVEKKQLRGERQKETSCTSFRNLNFRDKDALRDGGTKSDSGLHLISNPNKSQLELAQTQLNSRVFREQPPLRTECRTRSDKQFIPNGDARKHQNSPTENQVTG